MGETGPIQTFVWIGGLGSSVSLCLGSTCRRRRKTSPAKGEPKRTRLDEQELARKEWRMREEDKRRQEKQEVGEKEEKQSVARLRRSNIEEVEREVQSLLTEIEKDKEHVSFTERMKNLNYCDVFTIFVVFVLFSVLSGMNVMTSYMVEIFRSLEVSKPVLLISYGAAELVFSFLQMTIADMFGR